MNILIITTYYPPDTAVAAVRPYMFAKYLTMRGHKVTVLRSGEFYNSASDFFDMSIPVRVISYLGPDSPAERYVRGELKEVPVEAGKSRIAFLPEKIRKPIAWAYNACMDPVRFMQAQKAIAAKVEKQKAALDAMSDEHFDVVFSTFGQQENIAAAQYAAKLFGCKLIQDFRDPLARTVFYTRWQYRYLKRIQDTAIKNADGMTTVSEGFRRELTNKLNTSTPNITLYNGYEPTAQEAGTDTVEPGVFTFCYTGILYEFSDFTPLLQALKQLAEKGSIDLSKVKLNYAGKDFDRLQEIARNMGMEDILINHGYVSRAEALRLQRTSDIFLVLSWNRHDSQGVLPAKLYEGIRAKKTILSLVSGDAAGSELNYLNEKFGYGFCYEEACASTLLPGLCDFLEKAYHEKMESGTVQHTISPELEATFRYDNLAKKLEEFMLEI